MTALGSRRREDILTGAARWLRGARRVMGSQRRRTAAGLPPYVVGFYRRFLLWIPPTLLYVTSRRRWRSRHTSDLTVIVSSYEHSYVQNLRRAMRGAMLFVPIRQRHQFAAPIKFIHADIFHLHFVDELGLNLNATAALIGQLQATGTKIVWTAHDLTPHSKLHDQFDPIFSAWAAAADGVIHHSHFGEKLLRERYDFAPHAIHTVIENRYRREHADLTLLEQRTAIETDLGLPQTPIRIGLLGSPRVERKVAEFLRGAALSTSQNFQVVRWSLRPEDEPPHDPRIAIAQTRQFFSDETHSRRLAICDLIALPIDPGGEMLTTGLVPDAFAMGLGILASDWEFLRETCGDAAILCGHTPESVAKCLDQLTVADVRAAREASRRLRKSHDWESARQPVAEFYRNVRDLRI